MKRYGRNIATSNHPKPKVTTRREMNLTSHNDPGAKNIPSKLSIRLILRAKLFYIRNWELGLGFGKSLRRAEPRFSKK